MTAEGVRPDPQIEVQARRLIDEHAEQHSPDEIERLVHESAADIQGARVQQYLPNLVYNDVKGRLVKEKVEEQRDPA
jgi:hypothetical protein